MRTFHDSSKQTKQMVRIINDFVEPVARGRGGLYLIALMPGVAKQDWERLVKALDKYAMKGADRNQVFGVIDQVLYNMRTSGLDTLGPASQSTFERMVDAIEAHVKAVEKKKIFGGKTIFDPEKLRQEIDDASGRFAFKHELRN